MIGRLAKAIGVGIAATLLGSLILALVTVAYGFARGDDTGITMTFIQMRLPALLGPMFVCSLLEMLVILLPASQALRQFSGEPAWAYILVGAAAAALVALLPFDGADKTSILAVFAPYGASTGGLYWFAFRRGVPRAAAAAAS